MDKWILKFNNARLAVLCNKCSKIIKTGIDFTEKELEAVEKSIALPPYYCDDCKIKYKVYKARRNEPRYFELQENGDYLIWGESYFMRCSGIDELQSIDYENGPYINVGMDLKHFGLSGIIKEIKPELNVDAPNCYRLILQ